MQIFAVLLPKYNRCSSAVLTGEETGPAKECTCLLIINQQTNTFLFLATGQTCPGKIEHASLALHLQHLLSLQKSCFEFDRSSYLPKGVRHARLVLDSCHVLHQGVLVDLHRNSGTLQAAHVVTNIVTVTSIPPSGMIVGYCIGGSSV